MQMCLERERPRRREEQRTAIQQGRISKIWQRKCRKGLDVGDRKQKGFLRVRVFCVCFRWDDEGN